MSSRKQRLAAIILGCAAIISVAWAAARFAESAGSRGFVLERAGPAMAEQEPLNINTASQEELEALPGIGSALAARIIARRESEGPFEEADDLLAVSGVGETIYETIRPYITF